MAAAGLLFALLFVAAVLGTIGLWYVIDRETEDNPRMNRADAERVARQDTDGDAAREEAERETDDGDDRWGSDGEWGVDES